VPIESIFPESQTKGDGKGGQWNLSKSAPASHQVSEPGAPTMLNTIKASSIPGFFDTRSRAHIRSETTRYADTIIRMKRAIIAQPRVSGGFVKLNGQVAMTESGGCSALRGAIIGGILDNCN
jgi:hypothetical protein